MLRKFMGKQAGEPARKLRRPFSLYRLMLITTICAIVLAGCGGAPASSNNPTTAPSAGNTAAAPASGGAAATSAPSGGAPSSGGGMVQLKYASWGSPTEVKAQQAAVDSFNKAHPNIHVTYQTIPTDYVTKLTTMIAGKQDPDVYLLFKVQALQWGAEGKLYNLKTLMQGDPDLSPDKLIPHATLSTDANTIVGVKATEEAFALFYNKDLFTAANLDLPPATADKAWSWDQFVQVCQKLTLDQQGRNGLDSNFDAKNIKQYGVTFNRWAWFQLFPTEQTSLIAKDGSKLNLDDPAVADSIQKLADLINKYHCAPNTTAAQTLPAPAVAMQSKRVAMDLDGQWVQPDLVTAKINWDVGVMPMVKVPATLLFGEPMVMSAHTQHPKEAWEFYKWMVNPSSVLSMHQSGLWMPTVLSWYQQPDLINQWATVKPGHTDNYKTAVMEMASQHGVNADDYYLKNAVDIDNTVGSAIDNVYNGKTTAAQALQSIAAKANSQFKGVYAPPGT